MKSATYFLLMAIGLLSCKLEPTEFISLQGYVRYIEPEHSIRGQFTIKSGMDSLHLTADTIARKLAFQNQILERKSYFQGYRYQLDEVADRTELIFVNLERADGKPIGGRYEFPHASIQSVQYLDSTSRDITVNWEGNEKNQDAQILCMIIDEANHAVTFPANTSSQKPIRIPAEDQEELQKGMGKIYLIRQSWIKQIDATSILNIQTEYYSKEFAFEIR
ncbi:MAG: hypothetical protein ABIV51_04175 [Saprospiraceae bacterium]